MNVEVKGNNLIITLPMNKQMKKNEKSGKTYGVATSGGNKSTGIKIHDCDLIVGVNAYVRADEFESKNETK